MSIISKSGFEIESFVPEADIAKVKIENQAKLTLDAYGDNEWFDAKVVSIDPAETIIENVATYKIVLHFLNGNDKIKSGMTANIDIATAVREDIIAVPQRAVITSGREKFVRVLSDNAFKEVRVTTGIRGSDGRIEIQEGLQVGDRVIIFLEE